jgi:hypothetical protein
LDERSQFERYMGMRTDMLAASERWDSLGTAAMSELEAQSDNRFFWSGRASRAVLDFFYGANHQVPPVNDSIIWPTRRKPFKEPKQPMVLLYPNPASNSIQIVLNNPDVLNDGGLITIFDSRGGILSLVELKRNEDSWIINTSQWASGLYFAELKVRGSPIWVQKFQIIR